MTGRGKLIDNFRVKNVREHEIYGGGDGSLDFILFLSLYFAYLSGNNWHEFPRLACMGAFMSFFFAWVAEVRFGKERVFIQWGWCTLITLLFFSFPI